jgi:hypothetical protein
MKLVNTNKNHLMVGNGMNDVFFSHHENNDPSVSHLFNQKLKNNIDKLLYQN